MGTTAFRWYDIVGHDDSLQQGDFLRDCPVIVPSTAVTPGKVVAEAVEYDVVVMSQSCDLKYKKLEIVLVCPIWNLSDFCKRSTHYQKDEAKEALRRGYAPGYHLLNKCDISGFESDYTVVDFRAVYGVHVDFLNKLVQAKAQRLRLLPPYREHLAQAFARFFMRVGLPVDIPAFSRRTSCYIFQ
jgi:hypothetical protein